MKKAVNINYLYLINNLLFMLMSISFTLHFIRGRWNIFLVKEKTEYNYLMLVYH